MIIQDLERMEIVKDAKKPKKTRKNVINIRIQTMVTNKKGKNVTRPPKTLKR